jgi:hypothetical protein
VSSQTFPGTQTSPEAGNSARCDEPCEFSWTSVPRPVVPGEQRSTPGVRWWFVLEAPEDGGTAVEHRVLVTPPEIGAQEMAELFDETNRAESIRPGMQVTLELLSLEPQWRALDEGPGGVQVVGNGRYDRLMVPKNTRSARDGYGAARQPTQTSIGRAEARTARSLCVAREAVAHTWRPPCRATVDHAGE